MGGPERALHDAGNNRALERYSDCRIARRGSLNNPATAGEDGDQAQLVTPRQWARSTLKNKEADQKAHNPKSTLAASNESRIIKTETR
jgi:hypothetical protein